MLGFFLTSCWFGPNRAERKIGCSKGKNIEIVGHDNVVKYGLTKDQITLENIENRGLGAQACTMFWIWSLL
jgi:hypothetical protein